MWISETCSGPSGFVSLNTCQTPRNAPTQKSKPTPLHAGHIFTLPPPPPPQPLPMEPLLLPVDEMGQELGGAQGQAGLLGPPMPMTCPR